MQLGNWWEKVWPREFRLRSTEKVVELLARSVLLGEQWKELQHNEIAVSEMLSVEGRRTPAPVLRFIALAVVPFRRTALSKSYGWADLHQPGPSTYYMGFFLVFKTEAIFSQGCGVLLQKQLPWHCCAPPLADVEVAGAGGRLFFSWVHLQAEPCHQNSTFWVVFFPGCALPLKPPEKK